MRRKLLLLLFIPLLLCGALGLIKHKRDEMPSLVLARYPQNETFRRVIKSHLREDLTSGSSPQPLLLTTFFAGGSLSAIQWCHIDRTGYGDKYREAVYSESRRTISGAAQAFSEIRLNSARRDSLRAILAQLPPSEPPQSRGDLLLVSFDDGGAWTTRIYSKKAPPTKVKPLLLLIEPPTIISVVPSR